MKVISPRGVGFPDYTDILHRVAIETLRDQHYWYFTFFGAPFYVDLQTNTWYEFQIPTNIPKGYELYITTFMASISTTNMIEAEIYDEDGNLLEKLMNFQKVLLISKEGIKYGYGKNINVRIFIHSETQTDVLFLMYMYGFYQKKEETVSVL